MSDSTLVRISYRGKGVADGSMPLHDTVNALQGFSGAYNRMASKYYPQLSSEIRVSAIKPGSHDVFLVVSTFLAQHPQVVQLTAEAAKTAGKKILGWIVSQIQAKKHTRGGAYTHVQGDNNTTIVINEAKVSLAIPNKAFEGFKTGLIGRQLEKVVSPLGGNGIESLELKASTTEEEEIVSEEIASSEREYFQLPPLVVVSNEEFAGEFVSLNKKSNRGSFKLTSGESVRYHYVGDQPKKFHKVFGAGGRVHVIGEAHHDDSGKVKSLNVRRVKRKPSA